MTSDLRDSYFNCLLDEINEYRSAVLLTVDMGAKAISMPEKRREARIINCGVSEANTVSVAAGLSSRGIKAFVYGISAFLMNRPRAQIRHDAIIGNNPVHLIGSGPGLAYDRDGPSHHSLDDIALARTLPNFVTYSPFDRATAERAVKGAMTSDFTTYCRLDKGSFAEISPQFVERSGLYVRLADQKKWIVCTGILTHAALIQAESNGQSIVSLFEIGPQTVDELGALIPSGASVSVLDETHESGGIFQLVSEVNLIYQLNLILATRGIKNKFVQEKLGRDRLYREYLK